MNKKLLDFSYLISNYIFSLFLLIPLINLSFINLTRYKSVIEQNPKAKDLEEMNFIFDNLASENILLENGFVIALDFHTFLRAKTIPKGSINKNILFENLQSKNDLLFKIGSKKKLSWVVSCRYADCSKDIIKLDIESTGKKSTFHKDEKITIVCNAKEFKTEKVKNFKMYDCLLED